MATYKGNDIARPDFVDSILHLLGQPALNQPNVEEDLGMWPEAASDYVPRPGQKNYLAQELMAHAARPSTHPNGYWLGSTPATVPGHALQGQWGEPGVGADTESWVPLPVEDQPVFPVTPGQNALVRRPR